MGRGNPKIVGFSSDREGKIMLKSSIITNEVIAMMTGNAIVTASQNITQRDELVVNTNATNLLYTPVPAGTLISVYKLNADGTHGAELTYTATTVATGQYSRTAKAISLFAGDVANGSKIVAYYTVATDATANKISITSDKFAGTFKVVMDCLVRSAYDKQDYAAQVIGYNCKMSDGLKFSMSSSGDPTVMDIELELLKPSSGVNLMDMIVFDQTLLT